MPLLDHTEVEFDVDELPFSVRGAWINVSRIVAPHKVAEHLHLLSHRRPMHLQAGQQIAGNAVLEFIPTRHGEPVAVDVRATPSRLTACAGGGLIEMTFDGLGALRVRGMAIELELRACTSSSTDGEIAIDPVAGAHVVRDYPSGRRFRVTRVRGSVSDLSLSEDGRSGLRVTGAEGWEIGIEEMTSTAAPYRPEHAFDELVSRTAHGFAAYCAAVAPWRDSRTPAAALAAYTLWSATVSASGILQRESILMSMHWMDMIWSWDHCFNARAATPHPRHDRRGRDGERDPCLAQHRRSVPSRTHSSDHSHRQGLLNGRLGQPERSPARPQSRERAEFKVSASSKGSFVESQQFRGGMRRSRNA